MVDGFGFSVFTNGGVYVCFVIDRDSAEVESNNFRGLDFLPVARFTFVFVIGLVGIPSFALIERAVARVCCYTYMLHQNAVRLASRSGVSNSFWAHKAKLQNKQTNK